MKMHFVWLIILFTAVVAAQQRPLDNQTILDMTRQGLSPKVIVMAIQEAPAVDFQMLHALALANAGVQEDVIRAMAAKSAGRPIPPEVLQRVGLVPTAPVAPAPATPGTPSSTPPVPRQRDSERTEPGMIEASVLGGVSASPDRPGRAVAGVFGVGAAAWLHPNIAVGADYAYHAIGAFRDVVCTTLQNCIQVDARANFHEFTTGPRFKLDTRIAPYAQPLIGFVSAWHRAA